MLPKSTKLARLLVNPALVAQRIEHLTTDQKVGGSSPSKRAFDQASKLLACKHLSDSSQGS